MSGYYFWPWLPIGLGAVIWLGIGFLLFTKYFVMGLIGYTNGSKSLFPYFYTAGCILFWPLYIIWLVWEIFDLKEVFLPKKKVWKAGDITTCIGKGGRYEVLCIAKNDNFRTAGKILTHDQSSKGAGKSRGEILELIYVSWERTFYYVGFTHDTRDRIFYQDTESGLYYHREIKDFSKRMKCVK